MIDEKQVEKFINYFEEHKIDLVRSCMLKSVRAKANINGPWYSNDAESGNNMFKTSINSAKLSYVALLSHYETTARICEKEYFMGRLGMGRRTLNEKFSALKLSIGQFRNMKTIKKDEILKELKDDDQCSVTADNKQFLSENLVSITKFSTSLCDELKESALFIINGKRFGKLEMEDEISYVMKGSSDVTSCKVVKSGKKLVCDCPVFRQFGTCCHMIVYCEIEGDYSTLKAKFKNKVTVLDQLLGRNVRVDSNDSVRSGRKGGKAQVRVIRTVEKQPPKRLYSLSSLRDENDDTECDETPQLPPATQRDAPTKRVTVMKELPQRTTRGKKPRDKYLELSESSVKSSRKK